MRTFVSLMCAGLLVSAAFAVNINTVTVADVGNEGKLSANSYGSRICGSVDYAYNIGQYEVTAGQYTDFLNAVAATDTYGLYNIAMSIGYTGCGIKRWGDAGNYTYTVDSDWANRPVNLVSFWDACRFTNWLSNGQPNGISGVGTTETGTYTLNGYTGPTGATIQRNPGSTWAVASEDEWYKAAYYNSASNSYYEYPTSTNSVPGRDLNDVSGNNANYYGDPYPIQSPYYTTVVGELQNSSSPYGTFDQGGNIKEWVETVIYSSGRGLRGGSYADDVNYCVSSYRGGFRSPSFRSSDVGFRVVQLPEPASLCLLALGGCVLTRRRAR